MALIRRAATFQQSGLVWSDGPGWSMFYAGGGLYDITLPVEFLSDKGYAVMLGVGELTDGDATGGPWKIVAYNQTKTTIRVQTKDATSGFAKPFTIEVIGDVKDPPAPGDIISYVGMKAGSFTTNNTGTITWASSPEITMPVAYQNKCEVDWGIPEPSGGWYGQLSQAPGTSASPGPRNSLSMIETLQRRTGGAAFDGIIAAGFNVSLKVFVPADDGDDLNNSQSYVLVGAFGAIEWVSKEGEWQVQRTASGTYNVTYLGGPIQPRQVYGTVQDTIGVAISIDTLDEAAGTFRVRTYGAGLTSPGDLRFALQVIKV